MIDVLQSELSDGAYLCPDGFPMLSHQTEVITSLNWTFKNIMIKTAHDLVTEAKALIEEVSIKDAEQAIQDADVLIDVREADEYAAGHISGAIHASRGMLEFKLTNDSALSSRELKVVVYCKTSGRAALAAASMKNMGYLYVKSIMGGFDAWISEEKPIAVPHLPTFD